MSYLSGCRCFAPLVVALILAGACASPPKDPPAPEPSPPASEQQAAEEARADGTPCTTAAQCASGICEGQGCGQDEGRCVPARRPCTKDLVTFCGCDGETFQASGTCPSRTYVARGPCAASE